MTLKQIVGPTEAPVSLDELKAHIGQLQSTDNEDALLQLKLDAATAYVEGELGRPLITSTMDLCLERWPCETRYIDLLANTQSVSSVNYTGANGTVYTWSPTLYRLARAYDPATGGSTDCGCARLYPAYGQTWPIAILDPGEPIVIRLVAGWKDAANVPVPIKQAILMLASHWYRNRDAVIVGNKASAISSEMTLGVQRLTSVFEDRRF